MAQPFFPGIEDIMTILLGEMPEGVYANDRADSPDISQRSFTSSEIRAHAQVFANMYANLQDIYQNKFLTTVQPDGIDRWEQDLFVQVTDSAQPFNIRQENAISKYRAQGGLSYPYIKSIIASVLDPLSLPFDLVTYNCYNAGLVGAWILDLSQLDVGTYLAYADPLLGNVLDRAYQLDCSMILNLKGTTTASSPNVTAIVVTSEIMVGAIVVGVGIPPNTTVVSKSLHAIVLSNNATSSHTLEDIQIQNYWLAGVSTQDLLDIQATAYTYEVRIYGNANADTLSTLDQLLTQNEKATITHVIQNNFPTPPDGTLVDMGPFNGDTPIDNINCGLFVLLPVTYDNWDFGGFV